MIVEQDTSFKALTAPGYFNFSSSQTAGTAKWVAFFNTFTDLIKSQIELQDQLFRLWMTYDYSAMTIPRAPYLAFLARKYGLSWFLGTNNQMAALLGYIKKSYDNSQAINFLNLFSVLENAPFLWINSGGSQIAAGNKLPAIFSENLIIYSNAGSLPATPAAMAYPGRSWVAPAGWTKQASSSTYYSRGYLSGGNIVWSTPVSVSTAVLYSQIANLSSFPISPNTYDVSIVHSDATGDMDSIYYYDGASWRKNTTPNANQGVVGDVDARVVHAPNTDTINLSSSVIPPVSGPSQGYGIYGSLFQAEITSRQIFLILDLTTAGNNNLGIIIYLLKKLKSATNDLILNYSVNGGVFTEIHILDTGVT